MIDVEATVLVTDNYPITNLTLDAVTSDEPDNEKGDGNTIDDIQGADIGTADLHLQLRAERAGPEDGRVYTASYTVTDGSNNQASDSAMVEAPHDQQ